VRAASSWRLDFGARVVYERIACSPCLERTCRFRTYACFDPITPARVAGELEALGAFTA